MSTFVLLTITGLGLGAMYFLVASGLSLIYGLMGVLNFAHGAFITFGAYAAWWLTTQISTSLEGQLLAATGFAILVGAVLGTVVEVVFIRPLYRRPVEQVLVTVGLALALGALVYGIWGADAKFYPIPGWMLDTTTILGANIPNDRFVEIAVAVIVLIGLISLLRFTRIGLVIRAGVENRGMVQALGIDVRKAFTFVFALGGSLAALAGVLSGIYYGTVDPDARDVAAHLRLHRRRDRRLRLDRRLCGRRGRGRSRAAVRELLRRRLARLERGRRHRGHAPPRLRPASPPAWVRSEGRPLMQARRLIAPVGVLAVLAVVPFLSVDLPRVLPGPLDSPGTLQLLALCLTFAGVALSYDLLFGFTGLLSFGHALYFALGVYVPAIALSEVGLGPAGRARSSVRGRRDSSYRSCSAP